MIWRGAVEYDTIPRMKFCLVLLSLLTSFTLFAEAPYAFRERLERVHEPGRRDAALTPAKGEFAFRDGAVVSVPANADEVLCTAARDFADYLFVSMETSARVARRKGGADAAAKGGVSVALDPSLREREYRVSVAADGVSVAARDSRTAAQALYHLEDLMNLRRAPFLATGDETRRMRFSPRMTHSGWGVDMFPEGHLAQIAHAGMDAILVFVKDVHLTQLSGRQYQDVNALIRRARRHGLDVYLYSYVVAWVHPDDPKAKEVFDATYGRVAAAFPEAKGIVFVGESCQFPSKDERTCADPAEEKLARGDTRPNPGWFPCRDYPAWVRGVQAAIKAKSPNMEIVFWTYNWGNKPEGPRLELIDGLPKDVSLMVTFEMFQKFRLASGLESCTRDYSLAFAGPGDYFRSEAARAKRDGLRLYTQACAGGRTWDVGTAPFQPAPFQWRRRWDALVDAQRAWGLSGIMEGHHMGWCPSFVAELEKEAFTEGGIPFDEHLRRIAARDCGEANADAVVAVWKSWSEAARDTSPTIGNQYGPFRIGPAYPFNFGGPHIDRKDFPEAPFAGFGIGICFLNYTEPIWGERMYEPETLDAESVAAENCVRAYDAGADVLTRMAEGLTGRPREETRRLANLGRYLARVSETGANLKRGAKAWEAKDRAALLAAARKEYANAKAALPLVDFDSRLGWEPSMEYGGGRRQIEWKLRLMEKTYGAENLAGGADARWRSVEGKTETHPVQDVRGYNSWPMIQALPDGRLVCTYSRDNAFPEDGHTIHPGSRDSYAKTSADGGRTWGPEVVVADDPEIGEVNEGIGLDSTGAALAWVRCWGAPEKRRHELYRTTDGTTFVKIASLKLDPFPIQVLDPVAVPGLGLVSPWFAGSYKQDGGNSWGFLVSADDGKTWEQRTVESGLSVKEWVTESSFVCLGGGRILMIGRCEKSLGPQFQLTSTDNGRTWKKARTNIDDIREATPSLVYDAATGLVANYYYHRGAKQLKRRVAKADAVFANPTAWPEPEILAEGFEDRAWDAGNVKATRFGKTDYCAWYTGSPSNATVVVTSVPAS